ncbi:MAG: hypothetical protein EOO91_01785 [Pedobacter sp.]|nr:MAG: hypothetical protein EOO91_01785 [Pedobacter sp.]
MESLPEPNVKTTLSPTLSEDVILKYFALPEVEISYILKWLRYQARVGTAVTITDKSLAYYFGPFRDIVRGVNRIDNITFEKIITEFIQKSFPTSYIPTIDAQSDWTKLKLAVDYLHFLENVPAIMTKPANAEKLSDYTPDTWTSYFLLFLQGYGFKYKPTGSTDYVIYKIERGYDKGYENENIAYYSAPNSPGSKAISDWFGQYDMLTTMNFLNKQPIDAKYFAQQIDVTKKVEAIAAQKLLNSALNSTLQYPLNMMETSEAKHKSELAAIFSLNVIPTEGFLVVLFALIGLTTSKSFADLAKATANAPSSSPIYAYDTFINQLIYGVIMHLANPSGSYKWGSAKIIQFIQDLKALFKGEHVIKTALSTTLIKLQANPGFPITDVDADLSFSLRLNQTLGALNETAKDLRTSYPVTP